MTATGRRTLWWLKMRLKPDRVDPSRLPAAQVETGAVCHLRCPFCRTGNGTQSLGREFLTPELFSRMLDRLGPSIKSVALLREGEPLLNPRILDIVRLAADKGIDTTIHTSLSLPRFDEAAAAALMRCGLGELSVSCDGASRDTYALYRVGGRFSLVLRNMLLLLRAQRAAPPGPRIVWQFLVHRGNAREIGAARDMAARMGVRIRFRKLSAPPEDGRRWVAEPSLDKQGTLFEEFPACAMAWEQPSVHADGTVFPCCAAGPEHALGNLLRQPLDEIWNGPLAVAIRRYLRSGERSARSLPCYGCSWDPNAPERPRGKA